MVITKIYANKIVNDAAIKASASIQMVIVSIYCLFNVTAPWFSVMWVFGMVLSAVAYIATQKVVFDIGNFVRLAWKYRHDLPS